MKIPDLTELALRNLRESLLRNSLTTIGISVGVASLVAMLSLGIGLQQLASRRLVKSGLFDTVVVSSRRDLRGRDRDEERNAPTPGESRVLDEPARQEIEHLPNVLEAYPDIRFITELRYEDKPHLTMISALPSSAKSNDAFEGMQGRFFSADTAPEVILQKTFAEELLGKTPARGVDETKAADLAKPLLGKELTMRYAQRAASPAQQRPANADARNSADRNPDAVQKVVKGAAEAWKAAIANPDAAIAALKKREPLIEEKVERARLDLVIKNAILTERVRRDGLGAVDPARMAHTINMIAETFKLPALAIQSIYRSDYLPPQAELQLN